MQTPGAGKVIIIIFAVVVNNHNISIASRCVFTPGATVPFVAFTFIELRTQVKATTSAHSVTRARITVIDVYLTARATVTGCTTTDECIGPVIRTSGIMLTGEVISTVVNVFITELSSVSRIATASISSRYGPIIHTGTGNSTSMVQTSINLCTNLFTERTTVTSITVASVRIRSRHIIYTGAPITKV
jgi:hypothetical protein